MVASQEVRLEGRAEAEFVGNLVHGLKQFDKGGWPLKEHITDLSLAAVADDGQGHQEELVFDGLHDFLYVRERLQLVLYLSIVLIEDKASVQEPWKHLDEHSDHFVEVSVWLVYNAVSLEVDHLT